MNKKGEEDLIKELYELRDTLKADGYKDWCYARLTIDKAIKAMTRCDLSDVTGPVHIDFAIYLTGHDRNTVEQMFNDWNRRQ